MADAYYHGLIRKYITAFGSLFTDIYIDRVDDTGTAQKTLSVPLSYGPKEWYLARANANPNLTNPTKQAVLPRMSFELQALRYAQERKMNTTNQSSFTGNGPANRKHVMGPVPYDLHIRMSIMTRNADDGTRIVEQIVPRFTPELTVTLNSLEEMQLTNDIPIVLSNVELDDSYEGNMSEDDRVVIWNLDFLMKTYFYGPTGTSTVIKEIDLNFIPDLVVTPKVDKVRIRPGLTANGQPTSNSSLSIPYQNITADQNYGFVTDFFGLKPK